MGLDNAATMSSQLNSYFFYSNVFFWIMLSGIFFGAAISRITRFLPGDERREKARNRKWIFASLYFSLCVVFFLCGLLIPGPRKILDIRLIYFFTGAAVFSFIIVRFKKAIGLPVLILSSLFIIALLLFFQAVTAFTGETEIARIKVLSASDNRMKLELTVPRDPGPELVAMDGDYFSPVAKIVVFDDFLVFFGARTYYRFIGLTSFVSDSEGGIPKQATVYNFSHPLGLSETIYNFVEENEQSIPGIKTVQVDMSLKKARELGTYAVMIQNDGGVEIIVEQ
ncbi:MAG: hypothetical protein JW969_13675 [Spirochaetales bacterium]|nr:hypothetical protein [Spirochaetales bacterium]